MMKVAKYFLPLIVGICIGYYILSEVRKELQPNEDASFIYEKIEEVSKLVTLESHISEVYTVDETKKFFYDLIPIEKKALIIAKGKVQISYDLEQLDIAVNEEGKIITISNLPKPEYIVEPELNYYDLKVKLLPFTKNELTKVSNRAIQLLKEEAQNSHLEQLAEKNLEVQLRELVLVAKEKGWKVEIKE